MKTSDIVIRPATAEDIDRFSDVRNKPTLMAWVGEQDGKILGIGGFAFVNSRWVGFCDLTDEARRHKITIMRAAKKVMAEARRRKIRFIYANADPREPGATKWMQSLGFVADKRFGEFLRWCNGDL